MGRLKHPFSLGSFCLSFSFFSQRRRILGRFRLLLRLLGFAVSFSNLGLKIAHHFYQNPIYAAISGKRLEGQIKLPGSNFRGYMMQISGVFPKLLYNASDD